MPEARCYDCGKTPKTCWLPPHLCKHPDREGGEARNHEAEVEAALADLVRLKDHPEHDSISPIVKREAWARARAALDAVRRSPQERLREVSDQLRPTAAEMRRRSPQGEDHETESEAAVRETDEIIESYKRVMDARSPQGEDHEAWEESEADRLRESLRQANQIIADLLGRSQGEDHEAGIEAAWSSTRESEQLTRGTIEAIIAAYLSRCPSPKRDPERLVEAARAIIDRLYGEAAGCETAILADHVMVECRKALVALGAVPERDTEKRVSPDHDPGRTD